MMQLLSLLLLVLLAALVYLIYREYRRARSRKLPPYTEALIDLLDGKKDSAYAKLKETVTNDSENVDAYLRLAALLTERGQLERAGRIYQMLAVRRNLSSADQARILLATAREHLRAKRINKAVSVLEHIGELDPRDTVSREMLLFVYADNERWDDAKTLLQTLVKLQKDKHRAALYCTELGARLYAREPETATGLFEQALALDGKSVPALLYAGDAAYLAGRLNDAVAKWKQALSRKPELSFMVRDRMEKAFYETGRYDDMVDVYSGLISLVPNDTSLYVALARIYAKKGDTDAAFAVLARLPAERRSEVSVRLIAADLRLNQGNIEDTRHELAQLEDQLTRMRFVCANCGMQTDGDFLWRCPSCGIWESFNRVQTAVAKT